MIFLLITQVLADTCSSVTNMTNCLTADPFCMIIAPGQAYEDGSNHLGAVQSYTASVCRSLNFYTTCSLLTTSQQCSLANCVWDQGSNSCYEISDAPCQAYQYTICGWNVNCQVYQKNLTLALNVNYTIVGSQFDQTQGRAVGTWLYDFGLITAIVNTTSTTQTYSLTQCSFKQDCTLITDLDSCIINPMNCYFINQTCQALNYKVPCKSISLQISCESQSVPCYWQQNTCLSVNDPQIPCATLSNAWCNYNEQCFLSGSTCMPYTSCTDYATKSDCDNNQLYNCYYNTLLSQCQLITEDTPCRQIGQNYCNVNGLCQWNTLLNQCKFIGQLFDCAFYSQAQCSSINPNCKWDSNNHYCIYSLPTCTATICDNDPNKNCYLDSISNSCLPVQYSTPCPFQGPNTCGVAQQSRCVYYKNECTSAYSVPCSYLSKSLCQFGQYCQWNQTSCSSIDRCSNNLQQVVACNTDPLNCYYDYTTSSCRRVQLDTPCSTIVNPTACNLAICVYTNNRCNPIDQISCQLLTTTNCQYAPNCYFAGSCLPIDQCRLNDNNQFNCNMDTNHCYYDTTSNNCYAIDGNTLCSKIQGAANCAFGSCVLQPVKGGQLQCVEYSVANCSYLTMNYCHFGQCRWNQTSSTCQVYPPVTTTNGTSTNNTSTNGTTTNSTTTNSTTTNSTISTSTNGTSTNSINNNGTSTNTTNTTNNTQTTNVVSYAYIISMTISMMMNQ